jgi:hypothetical protein
MAPNRRRPVVGSLMVAVGVVHVGITPLLFPGSVQSIVEGGVVNSIEADPDLAQLRGIAFWYATTGLALIVSGWSVGVVERRAEPTPTALPLCLAGVGLWGVVLMPKSPFWVFVALAALAAARAAHERRADKAGPQRRRPVR